MITVSRSGYTPQPGLQEQFWRSKCSQVFLAGNQGSGKTYAAMAKIILRRRDLIDKKTGEPVYGRDGKVIRVPAIVRPGYKALVVTKTYAGIKNNIQDKVRTLINGIPGASFVVGDQPCIKYGGEDKVFFRGMDTDDSLKNIMGSEYTAILVDEATFIDWDLINQLMGRLRNATGDPCQIIMTGNPVGKSKDIFKREFVDVCPPVFVDRVYEQKWDYWWNRYKAGDPVKVFIGDSESYVERQFFPFTFWENELIKENSPDVISGWLATAQKNERFRSIYIIGDWRTFEGIFLPQWSDEKHIIPKSEYNIKKLSDPFQQGLRRIYMFFDHGYASGQSTYVFIEKNEATGEMIVFDELIIRGGEICGSASQFKFMEKTRYSNGGIQEAVRIAQEYMMGKYGLILHRRGVIKKEGKDAEPWFYDLIRHNLENGEYDDVIRRKISVGKSQFYIESSDFYEVWGDPTIWNKIPSQSGGVMTPAQIYMDCGLPIKNQAYWQTIIRDRKQLAGMVSEAHYLNANGVPWVRYVDTCSETINCMKTMEANEDGDDIIHTRSTGRKRKQNDHPFDAIKIAMGKLLDTKKDNHLIQNNEAELFAQQKKRGTPTNVIDFLPRGVMEN